MRLITLCFILFCYLFGFSQNPLKEGISDTAFEDYDLLSSYEDYAELEREVVYLHLNKSTYIKGESIGLKAYVFDKATQRFSTATSNLYCTIQDEKNAIVKQKLILINDGIGINDFIVDSLFTSGEYKITAYTNWMKNFDEKNYFSQTIRIIDPEIENVAKNIKTISEIDAQFLPEGGHLVTNVETIIGVTIKDKFGFGIPNIECNVINSKDEVITNFKLNTLGLGRFNLKPLSNETYKVVLKYDEKDYEFDLKNIQTQGIGLAVKRLKDKTYITLKTNESTFDQVSNKVFIMAIHNGNQLKAFNIKFNEDLDVVKAVSNTDLFSGINIITIFNDHNTPILERQIFNYDGLKFAVSSDPIVEKKKDSLLVSIPYSNLDTKTFNNFSISVLPEQTRAYNHHENISSSTLLQPHVRGYIENSQYYFQSITQKKQHELDNLLLTQGWSSYDWENIFNNPPDYDFDFENGMSYVANFANKGNQQLIIYPTLNGPLEIIELKPDEMSFEKQGFFPISNEKIKISAIDKKGKPVMPNISLKFDPEVFPDFNLAHDFATLRPREARLSEVNNYSDFENGWKTIEQLDEVKLIGRRKYTEIDRIKNATVGKVEFFDDKKRLKFQTIGRYLSTKGFIVLENKAGGLGFQIFRRVNTTGRPLNSSDNIPVIYLDDVILHSDLGILRDMTMADVEYIEVNLSGIGGGMRGGGGIVKIKTNPFKIHNSTEKKTAHKSFEIPLKFDVAKQFYIPKYTSYTSDFFNEYGVIDWFSNVSTDSNGVLKLKIFDNETTNLKLFIEGFSNEGTYISEVKNIKIN